MTRGEITALAEMRLMLGQIDERSRRTEAAVAAVHQRLEAGDDEFALLKQTTATLARAVEKMQPEVTTIRNAIVAGRVLGQTGRAVARLIVVVSTIWGSVYALAHWLPDLLRK